MQCVRFVWARLYRHWPCCSGLSNVWCAAPVRIRHNTCFYQPALQLRGACRYASCSGRQRRLPRALWRCLRPARCTAWHQTVAANMIQSSNRLSQTACLPAIAKGRMLLRRAEAGAVPGHCNRRHLAIHTCDKELLPIPKLQRTSPSERSRNTPPAQRAPGSAALEARAQRGCLPGSLATRAALRGHVTPQTHGARPIAICLPRRLLTTPRPVARGAHSFTRVIAEAQHAPVRETCSAAASNTRR